VPVIRVAVQVAVEVAVNVRSDEPLALVVDDERVAFIVERDDALVRAVAAARRCACTARSGHQVRGSC
jgi:hypothetical protein